MQKLPQAKGLLVRNSGTDPGGSISIREHKHSQPMFWRKATLKMAMGSKDSKLDTWQAHVPLAYPCPAWVSGHAHLGPSQGPIL